MCWRTDGPDGAQSVREGLGEFTLMISLWNDTYINGRLDSIVHRLLKQSNPIGATTTARLRIFRRLFVRCCFRINRRFQRLRRCDQMYVLFQWRSESYLGFPRWQVLHFRLGRSPGRAVQTPGHGIAHLLWGAGCMLHFMHGI